MALFEHVREVYGLLAEGDFARSLQGARLALSSLPVLDGQPALALHEAIVDGLHDFLAELHESGLDLEAAWGVPRSEVDVERMASQWGVSWREVQRLRRDGFDSAPLIGPSLVGSPEWLERMRRAMNVLQNPAWLAEVAARVGSPPNPTLAAIREAFTLLMDRGNVENAEEALTIARTELEHARGAEAERLALNEAAVFVLEAQLTEAAEHGESAVEPDLVDALAQQWVEVERLRGLGFSSEALIAAYVGGWMTPIGSRQWIDQTRRGVAHLKKRAR